MLLTAEFSFQPVNFFCVCVSLCSSPLKERSERRREGGKKREEKKGEGKPEGITAVVGGPQRPHLAGQAIYRQIRASQAQTESRILAVREAH